MSSHHFVKEQQEPAVFILSTEGISLEDIGPMLEWVPTVLVAEGAAEKVLSWGIKVDVLIASPEFQASHIHLLEEQYPLKFLTSAEGKELNDGLRYLQVSDHKAVHLAGFPHTNFESLQPSLNTINLTLVDNGWKYYPVQKGGFSKWFGETSIRILGQENNPIQLKNSLGEMIFPIQYLTQIDLPEGISELQSSSIFWIGEALNQH